MGARARVHAVGRGAGVRVEAPDAAGDGRSLARRGRPRVGLRDGVVELFLRGDRDGEVAVPEGRRLHDRDDLHVRVDEPRGGARHRAARADGLAVRARRVRRRPDHDRRSRAGRRFRLLTEARARRVRHGSTPRRRRGRSRRTWRRRCASRRPAGATRPPSRCPTSACCAASSSSATSSPASSRCSCRWSGGTTCSSTATGSGRRSRTSLLGPFIAVISFVCSIGNVPMAAALWHGGIGFGGVVSFIFADLITIPLLLIYRKYYGTAAHAADVRDVLGIDVAGRARGRGHLRSVGRDPDEPARGGRARPFPVELHDVLELRVPRGARGVVWLARTRATDTADSPYATDPTCGMQVEKANAPEHLVHDGVEVWFCSDGCRDALRGDARDRRVPTSVALPSDEQDRRHPRGGAEPLVRVLPAEDARGRAPARGDDPRAGAAAPDVRVGHLRRGRHHPRDDARHRHPDQPRDVAHGDGAPHVRGPHPRRAHGDRHALPRRRDRQHPRAARRPAQGSRSSARRARARHRSHRPRARRRRLLGRRRRAPRRAIPRRPTATTDRRRQAEKLAARRLRRLAVLLRGRACGSSSSTTCASRASPRR